MRIFLIGMLVFVGCEASQSEKVSDLQRQVSELSQSLAKSAARSVSDVDVSNSLEEVKKLSQFEYGIFTVPGGASNQEAAAKLNSLGAERWDCFFVERGADGAGLTFYCKRRPEGVLRYIPPSIAGGLLGLLR